MLLTMQVSVHSLGAPPPAWGAFQTAYKFDIVGPSDEYRTVIVEISSLAVRRFERGATEDPEAVAKLQRAAVTIALERITSLSSAEWADLPQDPDPLFKWTIDSKDEIYEALAREKVCGYQERSGRDLHCRASRENSKATQHGCNAVCSLPDDRLLCSAASHVRVDQNIKMNRPNPRPQVMEVLCDRGNETEVKQFQQCVPGGHDCWHRVLQLDAPVAVQREHPLALNEALDFFSFVWGSCFKGQKILRATRSHALAEISQPCASREEFEARLSAIDDVLKGLVIDDDLLSEEFRNSKNKSAKNATINRIDDAMRKTLLADEHGRLERPIRDLRALNRIRVGLQHGGKQGALPGYAEQLGVSWPPLSRSAWRDAWEIVRSRVARAFRELRQALEASMETSDNVQTTSP